MDRLRCWMVVTLISAFLPTIAWGQSPRVMVELAFVTRTGQSDEQPSLKEEFEKQLEGSELAKDGLTPFLDDWLRGKDRDRHEVDLMKLKIPLGEEVEFATRHSILPELQDPKAIFDAADIPLMPGEGLLSDGLDATVRADQKPDGRILTRIRFNKSMPATMKAVASEDQPDRPPVPVLHRQAINTRIELASQETYVLGGLLQAKRQDDQEVTQELAILIHVHLADPAPFPAN